MRQSRFGLPIPVRSTSLRSTFIVEPVGGVNLTQPASDLPLGQSPSSTNWITRNGFLDKRGTLVSRSTQSVNPGTPILGGMEAVDVQGNAYPFASYATRPLWYSVGSWSLASYVSAYGINAAPSNSSGTYWDMTQIYYDQRDENLVVMAAQSYQTLFCWQSNTTVFSTLTGAPQAKYVTAFDNFLLAFNLQEGNNSFVQRVQWSDRGSVSSWTGGLSGFQDLLDMRGQGTRIINHDNRVIAFSDQEIFGGRRIDFPFTFDFQPLDRTVGAPYPWTVAVTRVGLMWLGRDRNIYLLSKGENQARRIGDAIQPLLQSELDQPDRAWASYNQYTDQFELYYCIAGGSGRPQRAVYMDLTTGAWMPQEFDASLYLSRGWQGTLGTGSASTTWSSASAAGIKWSTVVGRWRDQIGATNTGPLAVYVGSSAGTLYTFDPSGTSDSGITVSCRWRSGGLGGDEPHRTKTLTDVRVDYQADSASSLTVRASANQGTSFVAGQQVSLPTSSNESQVAAYMYVNSRYPVVELVSEIGRPRVARLWATMRVEGR